MRVILFRKLSFVIARYRMQYGKYFPSFSYVPMMAKYEKQGKYLPISYEALSDNYFIIKCLLKYQM